MLPEMPWAGSPAAATVSERAGRSSESIRHDAACKLLHPCSRVERDTRHDACTSPVSRLHFPYLWTLSGWRSPVVEPCGIADRHAAPFYAEYSSRRALLGFPRSYRDDLESLAWAIGEEASLSLLPWHRPEEPRSLQDRAIARLQGCEAAAAEKFPPSVCSLLRYAHKLGFNQMPDYGLARQHLLSNTAVPRGEEKLPEKRPRGADDGLASESCGRASKWMRFVAAEPSCEQ